MQTSTNYRPATDGLSRIVEARFEPGIRWTQTVYISRRSLYLTFPLQADIVNRSVQMIAANSVIDVAVETVGISRSTRQTARIGSYVWERNEDTCQTHHHCHRAYFTVIPWTWWKLRFSFNRLHFWSRIMVWVCGHDTCKFRRAKKAFSVLLSRSFMLYYQKILNHLHFSCIFPTILWCRQHTRHLHSEV